jgi:hypothetical protein
MIVSSRLPFPSRVEIASYKPTLARNSFRFAHDWESIYGDFVTAAETRGRHNLTSRGGCRSAPIVLAADQSSFFSDRNFDIRCLATWPSVPSERPDTCARPATGLEPATSCVTGRRSNQLNYAPAN